MIPGFDHQSAQPHSSTGSSCAEARMARVVRWLNRHPVWQGIIIVVYFVFTVTFHDVMQQPAYWAQSKLPSHREWNNLVAVVTLPILGGFCLWMFLGLRRHSRTWIAGMYLAVSLAVAVACFHSLLCMNIEVVHFPQYAILAVLLFARTGSFCQTIVWAVLCGLIDEGYQYLYLYPDRRIYMDFNDVILNTVGAGMGLAMIFVTGVEGRWTEGEDSSRPFRKSFAAIAAGIAALTTAAMCATGFLRLFAVDNAGHRGIVLRRNGPLAEFWTRTNWGKTFHEVQPHEWFAASVLLIIFFSLLDRFDPCRDRP